MFSSIDDNDIFSLAKEWVKGTDKVLSELSRRLLYRNLFKIEIQDSPFEPYKIASLKNDASSKLKLNEKDVNYFVFTDHVSKNAYSALDDKIQILFKSGELVDIAEASDMLNTSVLSKTVRKYFLCYPKELNQFRI
jgi:uncharacterized membrane protein YfhO